MEATLRIKTLNGWPDPPGQIDTIELVNVADEMKHFLVQHDRRSKAKLVKEGQEGGADVLAMLRQSATQIILASFVPGCIIEPPAGRQGRIELTPSRAPEWHYLQLRDDDIVHFTKHGCSLATTITSSARPLVVHVVHPTPSVEVQVRSSVAVGEGNNDVRDDTGDETDDDLTTKDDSRVSINDEQVFSTARGSVQDSPHKAPALKQEPSISGVAETPLKALDNIHNIQILNDSVMGIKQPVFTENIPPLQSETSYIVPTPASLPQSSSMDLPPSSNRQKRRLTAPAQAKTQKSKRARSTAPSLASTPGVPSSILLTGSRHQDDKDTVSWLKTSDIEVLESIPVDGRDYVCIAGEDELPLKTKLLHSLVLGKTIVTDEWLEDSKKDDKLLPIESYAHPAVPASTPSERSAVFSGLTVFVTKTLYTKLSKAWGEVESLLKAAGAADVVHHGTLQRAPRDEDRHATIFVASDAEDRDVARFADKLDVPVYHRNLLWQSILQGRLLRDDPAHQLSAGT